MGTCKLCSAERKLRNSHILPEFMYGPVYEDGDHRFRLVDVETGRARLHQKGLREPLRCQVCENRRKIQVSPTTRKVKQYS